MDSEGPDGQTELLLCSIKYAP